MQPQAKKSSDVLESRVELSSLAELAHKGLQFTHFEATSFVLAQLR
jgi:hypothetical protein